MVCLSVILMRESGVVFYRPTWRTPFYPWLPGLGVVIYALLSLKLGWRPPALAGGFFLVGLAWFGLYARIRVQRESAMLHVVGRLAGADLRDAVGLEAELRGVLGERDPPQVDAFSPLLDEALVIDLPAGDFRAACMAIGEAAGPVLGVLPDAIAFLLAQHEVSSSSIMVSGVAAPMVEVPGPGAFQLVPARSGEGLDWPGSDRPVHAVFAILASEDRRGERLGVLTRIAWAAQDPAFLARWLAVRDVLSLKALVRLGGRTSAPPGA